MRLYIIIILLSIPLLIFSQNSLNLGLIGNYEWPATEGSDIWGWHDGGGNEYALVGLKDGFSVVDISNPSNPIEKIYIPDINSTWRDIKTWGDYAYITTESDTGLLIVDLTDMSIPYTYWHVTQFINPNNGASVEFTAAHNIYIDENGIAYIFGASSNTSSSPSNGAIFLDVDANPTNPVYLGEWDEEYIHDGIARGDTMYAACIYTGQLNIVDVSDKLNPQTIGQKTTPSAFTHNVWISDNGDYAFTTDEVSDAYLAAYDITDLNNIQEVDRIQSNPGSLSIPHNTHVDGNFLITSYYRDGTTVHDITYPNNMVQVAYYDSYSGSGNGFDGCWGTYPFLPSGLIISSDINSSNNGNGKLLIYERGFSQACYLEGNVTDISNGNLLNGVSVKILATNLPNSTSTNLLGEYNTGTADAGTYDVMFSKAGYLSDTLSISLVNGSLLSLNAQLTPLPSFTGSGIVIDVSGNGIPNAEILIYNNDFSYNVFADNNGNFTISPMYEGNYNIIAGKWGYITNCYNQYIDSSSLTSITLLEGYYDDFIFDFGWVVSGGITQPTDGIWERGDPEGTSSQGNDFNPEDDINNDCYDFAYVTGLQSGSQVGEYDVDDFNTVLTSPIFDLASNQPHYLSYYSWFANDFPWGGNLNDTLTVSITNGINTVVLERKTANSPNLAEWTLNSFDLSQHINLTSTMQLIIETADWDALGGDWVEGGFDKFEISSIPLAIIHDAEINSNKSLIKVIDILGRDSKEITNSPLFYIYDDGSIEKKIIIE